MHFKLHSLNSIKSNTIYFYNTKSQISHLEALYDVSFKNIQNVTTTINYVENPITQIELELDDSGEQKLQQRKPSAELDSEWAAIATCNDGI